MEVLFIDTLLEKFGQYVVAHYLYHPLPDTFSIELQFAPEDRAQMLECLRTYESAFARSGRLKKTVAETLRPR